ncbi:unnamed protein product [Pylaiella littoralis]
MNRAAAGEAEGERHNAGRRFHVTSRDETSQRVIEALQNLYRKKLRPVEEAFSFGRFHYDAITDAELEAKSQVLVIGQYSTGKTTFIRHMLGADFPNMNIGPEPTTDKFTVVIHGKEDRPVEGNSLALIKELPYEGLTRFGTGLLNKLDAAISTSPFLDNITLVDTPGVLSGEMQKYQRAYKFADVARWFADRSDMILVLFDAYRLDVSDELIEILTRLKDHQRSIRIVLNKADQVDQAKLRKVYGALMWSIGKVFDNPEVVRVYFGSFWDQPLRNTVHQRLFQADEESLTRELTDLPRLSAIRKINQLIKRTNLVRAHACVLSYLGEQTPWMYGRARRREDLLNNVEGVLEAVRVKHGLDEADMPEPEALRANLQSFDFADFPTLTPATLRQLTDIVDVNIHEVLKAGGGSENIFKFSKNRVPRPGILGRAGSSIRQLFGGGSGAVAAAPASAPEDKCNTINRFRSSPSSPATTTATPTRIPSQLLSSTPIPAAATGAAAAGGPAMATPAPMHNGETHNNDSVMHSSGVSQVAAEGGRPGQSQSEEGARVGRVLDTSKEGGEDSGVGGGGKDVGQRGKKAGFSCCACLQVLLLVLLPLIVLLFALEPLMASTGRAGGGGGGWLQASLATLADYIASARRFLTTGWSATGQNPEEMEALYRGTVH